MFHFNLHGLHDERCVALEQCMTSGAVFEIQSSTKGAGVGATSHRKGTTAIHSRPSLNSMIWEAPVPVPGAGTAAHPVNTAARSSRSGTSTDLTAVVRFLPRNLHDKLLVSLVQASTRGQYQSKLAMLVQDTDMLGPSKYALRAAYGIMLSLHSSGVSVLGSQPNGKAGLELQEQSALQVISLRASCMVF